MKIVIDLYPCQSTSRLRGIGRYTFDFVWEFVQQCPVEHTVLLLVNGFYEKSCLELKKKFANVLPHENFLVYAHPAEEHFPNEAAYLSEHEMVMGELLAHIQPDIYFSMGAFEGFQEKYNYYLPINTSKYRKYCILYDFIPLIYSKHYLAHTAYKNFYLERLESLKGFDHYFCISETTKRDGQKYLQRSDTDFTTIYGAVARDFITDTEIKNIADISTKLINGFILYGGNLDYRKNLHNMLAAFSQLPKSVRQEHPLVLTSIKIDQLYLNNLLQKYNLVAAELIYLGQVSDIDLITLYRNCSLFCMPSMYEGLGLPVLEAMKCGAVVLAGNNSSLREIVEKKEMRFDAEDPKQLSKLLSKTLQNQKLQRSIQQYGRKREKAFTWVNTCRLVWDKIKKENKAKFAKRVSKTRLSEKNTLQRIENLPDVTVRSLVWNRIAIQSARILVDITQMCKVDAKTGIQRVVKNILQQLQHFSTHEIIPVYIEEGELRRVVVDVDFVIEKTMVAIEFHPQDIFFLIDSSWEYTMQFAPHCKQLQKMGGKVVTMVYDLIPIRFPKYCDAGLIPVFAGWLRESIQYSDAFIAISRYTADELVKYIQELNLAADQSIYYAHLGNDPKEEKYSIPQTLDYLKDKVPTFLCVGTIEPRKGHKLVLDTFERLWNKGVKVRIVFLGKLGWKMDAFATRIRMIAKTQDLIWLEKADDSVLEECYRYSDALIMASEVEGFGLPIIEAAYHKLPVIASDIPVFREIGLDKVFYFERTPAKLREQIEYFISLDKVDVQRKIAGIPLLSWKESSELIYQQLLGTVSPYQITITKN